MSDRSYHHGNLRAELVQRAWREIEEVGVHGLSLRGLARDLGVSHGASARHFADKQALLNAVAVAGFGTLNDALETAGRTEGYQERFRAVGRAYVRFATEHPQILAVMYAGKHRAEASAELVELSHAGMRSLVAMITAAQRAGVVADGDPEQLATVAFAAVHGVAALATDDLLNGIPGADAADLTIEFVWRGLTSDPTTRVVSAGGGPGRHRR